MEKSYQIRVKYKNGKNQILDFKKNKIKRNLRLALLNRDKTVDEAVAVESWE